MRVLIVDDDEWSVARLVNQLPGVTGAIVEVCDSLAAVRQWLESHTARDLALAIVDLRLHGPGDGWDVINLLQRNARTANIPVIVRSALFNSHNIGDPELLKLRESPNFVAGVAKEGDDGPTLELVRSLAREATKEEIPRWPKPDSSLLKLERFVQRVANIVGGIRTLVGVLFATMIVLFGISLFGDSQDDPETFSVATRSGAQMHSWPSGSAPRVSVVPTEEFIRLSCVTVAEGRVWLFGHSRGWLLGSEIDVPLEAEGVGPIPPC
jgi:CheY-like chemotaxis protein